MYVGLGRARASSSAGEARVAELRELCRTAGVKVLDVLVQNRPEADPKFLVGRGKLDDILLRDGVVAQVVQDVDEVTVLLPEDLVQFDVHEASAPIAVRP